MRNAMYTCSGRVGYILYPPAAQQKTANFFIFYFKPENGDSKFMVKGAISNIKEGDMLELTGEWTTYKGKPELDLVAWKESFPMTEEGIAAYLGSGKISGVGKKTAKQIVAFYGLDTVRVIEEEPDLLTNIPGIGKKKALKIHESWKRNNEIKEVMMFLMQYGISASFALKVYHELKPNCIKKIKDNPYCLTQIKGIGFQKADTIAQSMGVPLDSFHRCNSAFAYLLNEASSDNGHVYLKKVELLNRSKALLNLDDQIIAKHLSDAVSNNDLIPSHDEDDQEIIYQPVLYYTEQKLACNLASLLYSSFKTVLTENRKALLLDSVSSQTGVSYNHLQSEAIVQSVVSKVMVLTGGPGSGKTTTTTGIITALEQEGKKVLLAAPTGRAAKRMTEVTGLPAQTIHRLLEYRPDEGFQRNEKEPLEGDVLIVDEASMIDMMLMNHLIAAIPASMNLILVGDIDQLPSVGAGNVLKDIIDSGVVPVIRLTEIFRQAETSKIITNAYKVNHGEMPILRNENESDFFFVQIKDKSIANDCITSLGKDRLPGYFNCQPQDIQVLSPMRKGPGGTAELNSALQKALNPDGYPFNENGIGFRVSDKVMQIKNDYDKGVYNGDIGEVIQIERENNSLIVAFDGITATYDNSEFDELTLAYAITIHKSQGSEYPVVVISLLDSHYVMLQRNLLYTAITRAKRGCVIAGTVSAIRRAVQNLVIIKRNTQLKRLLAQYSEF